MAKKARTKATALDQAFLADMAEPVRDHLSASTDLPDFLGTAGTLSLDERKLLVEQAILLLEQNYVHLPLKVAMHAVNPVQRLRVIRAQLERSDPSELGPEWRFHAALSAVFHSVRDLHTNYLLPAPFNTKIAYLPFQVEEYVDRTGPHHSSPGSCRDTRRRRASGRAPRSPTGRGFPLPRPSTSTRPASPAATRPLGIHGAWSRSRCGPCGAISRPTRNG